MTRGHGRVRVATAAGDAVCTDCRVADTFWSRLRGLLGTSALQPGEGLLFPRTRSVHTHFMRYPIDIVFVDAEARVERIVADLKPWRAASCRAARDVLELPGGECERLGLAVGDTLVVEPTTQAP